MATNPKLSNLSIADLKAALEYTSNLEKEIRSKNHYFNFDPQYISISKLHSEIDTALYAKVIELSNDEITQSPFVEKRKNYF